MVGILNNNGHWGDFIAFVFTLSTLKCTDCLPISLSHTFTPRMHGEGTPLHLHLPLPLPLPLWGLLTRTHKYNIYIYLHVGLFHLQVSPRVRVDATFVLLHQVQVLLQAFSVYDLERRVYSYHGDGG